MTDHERSLLASVFERADSFDEVAHLVAAEDFCTPDGQEIWRCCLSMHARKEPPELSALLVELSKRANGAELSASACDAQGGVTAATMDGLRLLAMRVHEIGALARVSKRCTEIASAIAHGDTTLSVAHDALRDTLESTSCVSGDFVRIGDFEGLGEAVAALCGERARGMVTGWRGVDSLLNGMRKSSVYVIAGRTNMGKTALALAAAVHATNSGPVLFASAEMPTREIAERVLRMRAEYQTPECLGAAADGLRAMPLYVMDTPGMTVDAIYTAARRLQRREGLALVVVDYLQLIRPARRYPASREREVSEVSAAGKDAAKRLDVPWVYVAQLNRMAEGRAGNKPRLSDLRESGTIENDADAVLLIYRPYYYDKTADESTFVIDVAKHRHGPTGTVEMHANLARSHFYDT